jgi:hypothetical protein
VGDDPIYAGGGPLIGDGYAACDMAGFVDDCALGRKRRCEGLLLETAGGTMAFRAAAVIESRCISSRLCRLLPLYLPPSVEE